MIPVLVSAKHRMLGVPTNPSLEHLFREAPTINGRWALLHNRENTSALRKLGYEVPAPILSQYDWPHPPGEPPFDAQIKTAAMLTLNDRAYVLNSMGTGKTRASLWAWDFLRKEGLANKLLVVAPLSTLKFTWAREVFATLPHVKCAVLYGTKAKRVKFLDDKEADIFIINHDGVKTILAELQARTDIDTLILDELAVYRNGMAQRSKTMMKEALRFKHVWGLTGAPIPNAPTDVWAQARIIKPGDVPRYFKSLREALMVRVSQFTWIPKPDATERAFQVLQPAVRFTLEDVVELPEAIYRTVDIELGASQARVYKELAAKCYVAVQKNEITAANAGACMNKLLQISTGYVYTTDNNGNQITVTLDNENRIQALVDLILSSEGKKLVFAPFKHALAGISLALKNENIEHAVMSGDTPAHERNEIFNLFQNTSKYQVLAAHPQCLAHGITLTVADTIIWFAPITSLEIYEQANMRIRRVGQKNKQLYLHLQGTRVEKRVYKLLQDKQNIQNELLGLFEVATQELN